MRLLSRIDGKLSISADDDPPTRYAILSHRWFPGDDEVSYRDVKSGDAETSWFKKQGLTKLDFCLNQAAKDGIDHVWIDSCCINREDKHEVGKSINKMYRYYADATVCYVYLPGVRGADWQQTLAASQWFTRGWTLQELVAPSVIRFYSSDRQYIGDRDSLSQELLAITGINTRTPLQDVPIHTRFQWSLNRITKEPEDISYCLLGILEVSIAANYGEGADKARERLLDAVEKEHGRKAVRQLLATVVPASSEAPLTIEQTRKLLQFEYMNVRRATISDPFQDTCEWLLRHPDYKAWTDRNLQFLWLKGKPGAGKSTLMKFAAQSACKDITQISYFFNARGKHLEKCVEGMYRSLLHQLLSREASTQGPVRCFLEEEQRCTGPIALTLPILQAAFRIAVRSITRTVQCFIDALDECKLSEVQDMIHLLEDVSYRTPLYICFASRYYPSITIKGKELPLEKQIAQGQDLMDYVKGRLQAGDDLKQQVIDKANGVFLWAVLVVRLLNAEISAGRLYNVQQHLDQLPSELNALLGAIVAPSEHAEEFRLAIQWITFARRPLSGREYYAAILIGLHRLGFTTLSPFEPWPRMNPDAVTIRKFIASTSRGLAELTQSSWSEVQFIHESVRDFLLHHGGLHRILTTAAGDLTNWAQSELSSMCFEYTKRMTIATLTGQRPYMITKYCFLEYSISGLFYHADAAFEERSRKQFLQDFRALPVDWQHAFCQMYIKIVNYVSGHDIPNLEANCLDSMIGVLWKDDRADWDTLRNLADVNRWMTYDRRRHKGNVPNGLFVY